VTSAAAAGRPARTLSDTRQRFPQWRISQSAEGWQAVPRATWTIDASTLDGLYERLEREEARREAAPIAGEFHYHLVDHDGHRADTRHGED
jgi:hypothetical protein